MPPLSGQVFIARLVSETPRPGISGASLRKAANPAALLRKGTVKAAKAKRNNAPAELPVKLKEASGPSPEGGSPKDEAATTLSGDEKAGNAPVPEDAGKGAEKTPPPTGTSSTPGAPPPQASAPKAGPAADGAHQDGKARQAGENPSGLLQVSREKLSYDIYWFGFYVGRAVLEAVGRGDKLEITSQVHSAQFISNFYEVADFAKSVLVNGLPTDFRIKQHEGRYRSDKETIFDAAGRKVTYFDYRKKTRDDHAFANPALWDVISGFYFLRTLPLIVGNTVYIDIFDSNKFLKAKVDVLGKERIKLFDKSEIDTVVVRPVLKSEGLFRSKGDIRIWLTDDGSRTPVKVEAKVPIGSVTAELKSLETGQ